MAEQLVNDQLMFNVLQRAMSEVVRSQGDGVLTDEVVEQLLDTTYAAVSPEFVPSRFWLGKHLTIRAHTALLIPETNQPSWFTSTKFILCTS